MIKEMFLQGALKSVSRSPIFLPEFRLAEGRGKITCCFQPGDDSASGKGMNAEAFFPEVIRRQRKSRFLVNELAQKIGGSLDDPTVQRLDELNVLSRLKCSQSAQSTNPVSSSWIGR